MINLNGIQIDEADLKRQLEAQGYEVQMSPKKRPAVWPRGTIVWGALEATGTFHLGDQVFHVRDDLGDKIPDELIRAYEKLHKYSGELGAEASCHNLFIISAAIYKKIQNMYGEINALKAQGEKR